MLPNVNLSQRELNHLLSTSYIGDLIEEADRLSIEIFKDILKKNPEYKLGNLSNDILLKCIESQSISHIPEGLRKNFLSIASDRQQFKRGIINKIIESDSNNLKLERYEETLIIGILKISSLFDQLFIDWYEKVINSDIGVKLKANASYVSEFRKKHNLLGDSYVFSIIEKDLKGHYTEVSLIKAFPVIINRIMEELEKLSKELLVKSTPIELINYIDGLITFYENEDPKKYKYLAKAVDMLWLNLSGDILPIHSMEVYDDPGKSIVSPEFLLAYTDKRYKKLNSKIKSQKKEFIELFNKEYSSIKNWDKSNELLSITNAKIYTIVSEAGARITRRFYGKNVPNWPDVRIKHGAKILIDMSSSVNRSVKKEDIAKKIFDKKSFELINSLKERLNETDVLFNLSGHEIAHNLFLSQSLRERLSNSLYSQIEETKASFAILSLVGKYFPYEQKKLVLLNQLQIDLLNLMSAKENSKIAYINRATNSMNILFDSKVLIRTGDKYTISLSTGSIEDYFTGISNCFVSLLEVYTKKDKKLAEDYIRANFTNNEEIRILIDNLIS